MAGWFMAPDVRWARERPGRRGKEDNAAPVQVLVARGHCAGTLEIQVSVAGSARATG